jgi:hypothetical protein
VRESEEGQSVPGLQGVGRSDDFLQPRSSSQRWPDLSLASKTRALPRLSLRSGRRGRIGGGRGRWGWRAGEPRMEGASGCTGKGKGSVGHGRKREVAVVVAGGRGHERVAQI